MKVSELVAILLTMPQDLPVEVNKNGHYCDVYAVDLFDQEFINSCGCTGFEPCVTLQTVVM